VIIFARVSAEIQRIPASGGTPQRVTSLDKSRHEGTHRWPFFLPDGNHFLFMAGCLVPSVMTMSSTLGHLTATLAESCFMAARPLLSPRAMCFTSPRMC
jgi:hypothetical protein